MLGTKNLYSSGFLVLIGFLVILPTILPQKDRVSAESLISPEGAPPEVSILQENTFSSSAPIPSYENAGVEKRIKVIVTAYSSSKSETDNDPFITASGERVRNGIVANNLLPFGSKIRLPEIFGDKVFEVQDRMHYKKGYYHIDVWFPSRKSALAFGSRIATMEVLSN